MRSVTVSEGEKEENSVEYIVNELLAYATYYSHRATGDNIKKMIKEFYGPQEISQARTVLIDNTADDCLECIKGKGYRRDSTKRNAADAELADIILIVIECDKKDKQGTVFVARDMARLPKASPEEMNAVAILDRLAVAELRIRMLQEEQSLQKAKITQLAAAQPSYAAIAASKQASDAPRPEAMPQPTCAVLNPAGPLPPPGFARTSASTAAKSGGPSQPSGAPHPMGPPPAPGSVRSRPHTQQRPAVFPPHNAPRSPSRDSRASSSDFRTVQRKRKPKGVLGNKVTSDNCMLKSGPEVMDIFVSRLKASTVDSNVTDFLKDEGVNVISIEKVSNTNAKMNSYKIVIQYSDYNKVMKQEFWPNGIACRRFFNKRNDVRESKGSSFVD